MNSIAICALALMFTQAPAAHDEKFVVSPGASEIRMTLQTTHEVVHGTFHVQAGSILFANNSAKLAGSIVVLAGSGETGNGTRDKKMTKDILDVGKYSTILFEPKSYSGAIAPAGDSTIEVAGIFTLLGTPHEITIPVSVHIEGTATTVKAHFPVPYVQWGLKDPSFLVWKADKSVAIDLSLSGQLTR